MKMNLPVTTNEIPVPEGAMLVSKTDLKGIITEANDDFVRVSGFSREELLGKNHNIVRHPDMPPAAFQDLWDTLKAGKLWSGIIKNRTKNGDYYWVEANVTPIREGDRTVGYMSVRYRPTREQVTQASELYRKINEGKANLRKVTPWGLVKRFFHNTRVATKLMALVGFLSLLLVAVAVVCKEDTTYLLSYTCVLFLPGGTAVRGFDTADGARFVIKGAQLAGAENGQGDIRT